MTDKTMKKECKNCRHDDKCKMDDLCKGFKPKAKVKETELGPAYVSIFARLKEVCAEL